MGKRIGEFGLLFIGVFAATFLLSRVNSLIEGPRVALEPRVNAAVRLILEAPDEHIEMPFRTVRVSEISDSWHEPRSGRRKHEGQDIFAPVGTPIYSATNGIVVQKARTPKGGNVVSVLGAGGRVYYYAHLDRFVEGLEVTDAVTTETLVGYVGTTGNAVGTPAHLHFGVYDYGGAMNPLPLLMNRSQVAVPHGRLRAEVRVEHTLYPH